MKGILLNNLPWVATVEPVETNILIFSVQSSVDENQLMETLLSFSINWYQHIC